MSSTIKIPFSGQVPTNPGAGTVIIFSDGTNNGNLSTLDSQGNVIDLTDTGGGGSGSVGTLEQVLTTGNTTGNYNIHVEDGYGIGSNVTSNSISTGIEFNDKEFALRTVDGTIGSPTYGSSEINFSTTGLTVGQVGVSNVGVFRGIEYKKDFSSNYTNRSLVDKEYVDNAVSGSSTTPYDMSFAISDETTPITSGTSAITLFAPRSFTLTDVKASLSTSGSSTTEIDIKVNGASILSTTITIDSGDKKSVDAATSPVISSSSITEDDEITVDIVTAGTGAAGAKIYLIGQL